MENHEHSLAARRQLISVDLMVVVYPSDPHDIPILHYIMIMLDSDPLDT